MEAVKEEAPPPPEAAAEEELPTQVEEADAYRLILALEKSKHAESQLKLAQTTTLVAQHELQRLQVEAQQVTSEVWAKYKMGLQDNFNDMTRAITRGSPTAKA